VHSISGHLLLAGVSSSKLFSNALLSILYFLILSVFNLSFRFLRNKTIFFAGIVTLVLQNRKSTEFKSEQVKFGKR
jgi:hypothetical protein